VSDKFLGLSAALNTAGFTAVVFFFSSEPGYLPVQKAEIGQASNRRIFS
jgi:hypothetical protein